MLQKLKWCWQILWYGYIRDADSNLAGNLYMLENSSAVKYIEEAFYKIKNELVRRNGVRIWDMENGEVKRQEVITWVRHYASVRGGITPSTWLTNFWIEYLVGREKGIL